MPIHERETTSLIDQTARPAENLPSDTKHYLSQRLDGARDLYLLALALGERHDGGAQFGRMIREARIHFAAVIEEARIAGLDTNAIGQMLAKQSVEDSIRPDLRARVEQLLSEAAGSRARSRSPR
jgi:hypothetical protein